MKHIRYIIILGILLLVSCDEVEFKENSPQLVIEGYIDDGGFPVVMLTTTVAVTEEPQKFDDLAGHMLRWAKVSVSDGDTEVILTGRIDKSYFPPFVYTTSSMRGEAGKSYTLKVEYDNYRAEAVTTIPYRPHVDSVKVEPTEVDSLCKISLCFYDEIDRKDYYKVFVRKGVRSKQWLSSFMGVINDDVLDGCSEVAVNQGHFVTDTLNFTPFFCYDDTVVIKFARIDQDAYSYWNDYENYISFSRNPFFPLTANLQSNIEGGFGCWYGCGAIFLYLPLCDYAPEYGD